MNKTTYFTLLLLTPALLCSAQVPQPAAPQLDAVMTVEREVEAATARGRIASREINAQQLESHGQSSSQPSHRREAEGRSGSAFLYREMA